MDLHQRARQQRGVLGRGQLKAAGVDRERVRTQLSAGRWQAHHSAIILHNGPVTREQLLWAAVLDQPQPCVLGGITALVAAGLRTKPRAQIHVVIPRGSRRRVRPHVVIHTAAVMLTARGRGVPRVTADFAVVQAGCWEMSPRVAAGVFVAAFQQGLVTSVRVSRALEDAPDMRHVRLMRKLLAEVEAGAGSLAEVEFVRLARRAGLPAPIRQAARSDGNGGRLYLDFDFGRFAVEVDGPLHWQDIDGELDRQNALASGQPLLRFTTAAIWSDPDSVIGRLRTKWQALARSA